MGNAPDVLMGLVPLIRAFVRSASTDTATTVTPDDSGTLFVNLGTSGTHTYTLPSVTDCKGKCFIFFNGQTTSSLAITGGTADKIIGVDDLTGDTITSDAVAGSACLIFGDGTWYYAITTSGAQTTAGVWTVSS